MFTGCIGKQSNKVKNTVERGAVKKFAESIGDPHPIFMDEEVGRNSRFGANLAPPTFPRVFEYGVIKELRLPNKGLIHGEQIYHYERPLLVGEDILCYQEVKDYYERTGKLGEMGILIIKRYGESLDGELIFTAEQIVILNEAVRRAVNI